MENRRFILLAVLAVFGFLLYQAWVKDYREPQAAAPVTASTAAAESAPLPGTGARISVDTDVLAAQISTSGGDLRRVELLDYPVHKNAPQEKLPLLEDRDGRLSILQAGLAGTSENAAYLTDDTQLQATAEHFQLAPGSDEVAVPLTYTSPAGYEVRKTYRFKRGSYVVEMEQTLINHSDKPLTVGAYARWLRRPSPAGDEPPFFHSFAGFGFYEQKTGTADYKFKKLAYKEVHKEPLQLEQTGGWLAMLQHYFVAAIIPPQDAKLTWTVKPSSVEKDAFIGQYVGTPQTVAPGGEQTFKTRLYIGPTKHGTLESVAPRFDLVEDYGFLTPVAKPLFWLLKHYHGLTGNWGVAIVLLTLTVRGAFYKLTEAQYRSSAKMRKFGPRIQQLRERYADDREALNKAMMDLYKKEGFNPLAGCWPMFIQLPVFMALYWVLAQSVELRQAPFVLWINDLTAADHFYVLPVLYGFTMWAMQRISGQTATMDPTQARIMNVMPIALTGMFVFFPSGLVLYWVVSNSISIAQQWYILRKLEREGSR
jgi:YidC/Oxa1 family membrane protein insertase